MTISKDIHYVGVCDRKIDLFEGQYTVPDGIRYNSYVIKDEKIAVMDTVDAGFGTQWLEQVKEVLGDRRPDYLIVQHMEPDHSANIQLFAETFPTAAVVATAKAFPMMKAFLGTDYADRRLVVGEGDTLSLGAHQLVFVTAPMVHWPEVMVTYDTTDRVLFSADAFGTFGTEDKPGEDWSEEAARYFIGIVGKYGVQVQALLKKAAALDIAAVCPLHGPVLTENIGRYVALYDTWSSYRPEKKAVTVAFSSVYGHTAEAVRLLADALKAAGQDIKVYDLARCDMAAAVADAFRSDRLVLATTTYNGDVFPCMKEFIHHLTERNFRSRRVALLENGSWAPMAAKVMTRMLEECKDLTFAETKVTVRSALDDNSQAQIAALAAELCAD